MGGIGSGRIPFINRTKRGWKSNCDIIKHGKWICWEWKFSCRGRDLRPQIKIIGTHQAMYAARFAYILFFGKLKYQALHHCDNLKCVRPSHLYDGTQSQNIKDAWRRCMRRDQWRCNVSRGFRRKWQDPKYIAKKTNESRHHAKRLWQIKKYRQKVVAGIQRNWIVRKQNLSGKKNS